MKKIIPYVTAGLIKKANKKEGFWNGVETKHHQMTTNMSGHTFTLTKEYDRFGTNVASDELQNLLLKACNSTSFCIHVIHSPFLSYPIFQLIYIPEYILKKNILLRWTRNLVSTDTQTLLEKKLYSPTNKMKCQLLFLAKIYPISSYEY
jgi:hypothetical protein